jgi:hypothetical protein
LISVICLILRAKLQKFFWNIKQKVVFLHAEMENLKEKTAKGLMWGAINNGTMQVLNLLIGIIVLRQLTPDDTGLVGMLAIFTAIAGNLQSSGFSTALSTKSSLQHNNIIVCSGLIS